jgi:aminopeptidase N
MTPTVDTMLLFFDRSINSGTRLTVTIKYQASLITSTIGLYQTTYVMDGITKYVAATQFEEVGARYAFPCFDEPEYKAVFEVKITHDASVKAFANTMETVADKLVIA